MKAGIFEVHGQFKEKTTMKKFCKRIVAQNERFAREKVYALIGSKHATKRRNIILENIKEVSTDGTKEKTGSDN